MIPTRIHGYMDYACGLLLIFSPWIVGLPLVGPETWIPVSFGGILLLYSLFTNYGAGVFRMIPMPVHLTLDGIGGAFLALSPWVLGFSDTVWVFHFTFGLAFLALALLTRRIPLRRRRGA